MGAKKEPKKGAKRKQVQKDVKELQEEGLLKREGSNRNGRWVVMVEKNEIKYYW